MQPDRPPSRLRALVQPVPPEARPASRLRALTAAAGTWEPDPLDPARERRALPGGGFEYRPAAQKVGETAPEPPQNRPRSVLPVDPQVAAKRAQLADIKARGDVGAVEEQGVGEMVGNFVNRSITATAEGLVALPELLLSRREHGSTGRVTHPDIYPEIGKPGGFFDLKAGREDIQRQYEEDKEQFRGANLPPAVTATLDTVAEAVGPAEGLALFKAGSRGLAKGLAKATDPTTGIESAVRTEFSGLPELPVQAPPPSRLRQLLGGPAVPTTEVQAPAAALDVPTAAVQADRRLNTALRQAVEAEIPRVRAMTPDARRALMDSDPGEAVERAIERVEFMEAKGTHAGPPAVAPQVPSQRVRTSDALETLPPERPPLPVAARVADDLPPGAGLRPREPEIVAPGSAEAVLRPRVPRWAPGMPDRGAFGRFLESTSGPIDPADLPFELVDLPLTRFATDRPSLRAGGEFFELGDSLAYLRKQGNPNQIEGGSIARQEWFTPRNPLVLEKRFADSPAAESALIKQATAAGHDAIILFRSSEKAEVIKTSLAEPGRPRTSPYVSEGSRLGGFYEAEIARMSPSTPQALREVLQRGWKKDQRGIFGLLQPAATESTFQASGAPRIEVPPQAVLPPPVRAQGGVELEGGAVKPPENIPELFTAGPPRQPDLPDIPAPSDSPPRMSTKGVENVAGFQDELAAVAKDNFDEIYAARGPVVPVSQWHDAPALQAKLGLAPDDYLKMPAGRIFSPDEGALGKHYLGNMRQEARALEKRITAGQVEDVAAAQAEVATRNRDVVRMMAVLQGQGSSEAGRYMRMLQEALDPHGLAETPKERLQLALLKNYGAKNADAAAAIEAKAVQRLKRLAERETRKAGRAATAEQLSSEFSSLAAELGALTRKPRGMGGGPVPLDPELVAVIGKMASNRIRAGVVAIEELADQVYSAVRQTVGATITREQVKASIVEHALAKKPKLAKPPTDPAARRLKTAEANVARQVKKLEDKLAAGPKRPGAKLAPVASDRLADLRQRAADLRSQIEKDPKHSLVQRYRELLDDETVEMISRLPDPTENPGALVNFLRQMERPTFREYAGAFAYQNMLSGPKSLIRNVIGNTVKRWDRIILQPVSAGVEAVLAPLQGRVRERYLREVLPAVVGSYRGAPEALQKGLFVLKNGYDPQRLVDDLTGVKGNSKYYEAGRLPLDPFLLSQNRAVRAFGAVNGWGIRGMQIGDAMAKARNFSSASHAWATRKALMEGKKGGEVATRAAELLAEQPDEMIQYAQRLAREDTFQDEVSNIAKLVGAARREDTGMGWALAQTIRFLNVPDRIAAWFADYTPGLRVAGAAWKGGKLRQAWGTPEASDLLARQAVGTAVAAAAAAWAFDGKLVGAAPKDEKLKNDFYAAGKQSWSVLVGGEWVPIRDAFGGWAAPVAAAAAFHDNALTGEPVDSEEILRRSGGAALGEMRYLLDANYMSNLSDVVSAIEQEPTAAGKEVAGLAARTAAGALIPQSGLLRNVAIYRDPRVVDKQKALDEVKAGLPGSRKELPARLGSLDEELVATTGKAGGFSPVVPTESKLADPALAEDVERLRFTLSQKRTEIRKLEKQLENARKAKDAVRVRELRAAMPRTSAAELDGFFEGVRADEQRVRELRAKGRPIDAKAEVRILKSLRDDLLGELRRLGETP